MLVLLADSSLSFITEIVEFERQLLISRYAGRENLIAVFFFCLPVFFREFLLYLQRYKSFFAALPEMLCEGETVVDGSTCWVGNDLSER